MAKLGSLVCGITLLLVTLKFIDAIDSSWLWVLAPAWIPLLLAGVLFIAVAVLLHIDTSAKGGS